MDPEEVANDTRRMQIFLLGCQENDEDADDYEADHYEDQHEYFDLDNPPNTNGRPFFGDNVEMDPDAPITDEGSSYQQYVSSPSQSFNSQPVTSDEENDEEMDLDEQITCGTLPANVANLYKVNQAYQREIARALQYLHEKLEQNRKEQAVIKEMLQGGTIIFKKDQNPSILYLSGSRLYGSPYFMDHEANPAPPTKDARHFAEAGVVSLTFHKHATWLKREIEALEEEVYAQALKKKTQDICEERRMLQSQLHPVIGQCRLSSEEAAEAERKCRQLTTELKSFTKLKRSEVLGPLDAEHDWEEIARTVQFRMTKSSVVLNNRTAEECHLAWLNLGHPSFYRGAIRPNEEVKLKELLSNPCVDKNDVQELTSHFPNRSEFWVFRELRHLELGRELDLTPEEESTFSMLCEANQGMYFPYAAEKFMRYFPSRSYYQLYAKYKEKVGEMSVSQSRRRLFSRHEDMIILKGYAAGLKPEDITRILPHRKIAAISNRYKRLKETGFEKEYITTNWNRRQDRRLLHAVRKFKDKGWEHIQSTFFPHLTVADCQRRMMFLKYHSMYAIRQKNSEAPVIADLKGKFGRLASSAVASIKGQHYMKSFHTKQALQFKLRRQARQALRLYLRPYYCKAGRQRGDIKRNPASYVKSEQSRSQALQIFKYLKFFRAPLPKMVEKYNEDPTEVIEGEPCINQACDSFTPPAVKSHLVHLLSQGKFATEDNEMEPVPEPEPEPEHEGRICAYALPPSSQSLLMLRSMLLHREYFFIKCAQRGDSTERKPNVGNVQMTAHNGGRTAGAPSGSKDPGVPGPSGVVRGSRALGDLPGEAKARAMQLLFDRVKGILQWPAILATKPPSVDLKTAGEMLASKTAQNEDGEQYRIGVRGGIVRPKKTTMTKYERRKFRAEMMKARMDAERKAKGITVSSKNGTKTPKANRKPGNGLADGTLESHDENFEESQTDRNESLGLKKAQKAGNTEKKPRVRRNRKKEGSETEPPEKRRSTRLSIQDTRSPDTIETPEQVPSVASEIKQ